VSIDSGFQGQRWYAGMTRCKKYPLPLFKGEMPEGQRWFWVVIYFLYLNNYLKLFNYSSILYFKREEVEKRAMWQSRQDFLIQKEKQKTLQRLPR
jgi:hypothetical protein